MARRIAPVYWKPTHPSRVTRERAWATRALARERSLELASERPSLLARLAARFRRTL